MWTRPAIIALLLATGPAQAQSPNGHVSDLELCLRNASLQDEICSKLKNEPLQQLECWRKTQASQVACLERVLADQPSRPSVGSSRGAAPPSSAESPPDTQPRRESADDSNGKDRQQGAANRAPNAGRQTEAISPDTQPATGPQNSAANASSGTSPDNAKAHDAASAKSSWLVSETTSPIDYSPIVDAEIRPIVGTRDGPETLVVRCRARRIEVVIRRNQAWSGSAGQGLDVEYQVGGWLTVREPWILSADRKAAKKGNPVEFLRSMPDGATLKMAIRSQPNAQYTRFELVGLSAIRSSIEKACGQPLDESRASSRKP